MRFLVTLCRYILGIVFIVSGFLKAIDPVGTGLKISEYVNAITGHIVGLEAGAFAAMALCTLEFLTGVCVLKVLKFRPFSALALFMCIFFTLLTLYSAVSGKIADCGCFGEILKLSAWHSFYKNLILLLCACLLYSKRAKVHPVANPFWEWIYIVGYAASLFFVSLYAYRNLPPVDFTDFRQGRDLMASDSLVNIKYKTEIVYSKDGVSKAFDLKHLPDSTWKYERTISTPVEGSEKLASQMRLQLRDASGVDVTNMVLSASKPQIFIVLYNAESFTSDNLSRLKNVADSLNYGQGRGDVHLLSSLSAEDTYKVLKPIYEAVEADSHADIFSPYVNKSLPFDILYSDFKNVITLNRANGGAIYIKEGKIIRKWGERNYSTKRILKSINIDSSLLARQAEVRSRIFLLSAIVVFIFMVLIIRFVSRALYKTVKSTVDTIEEIAE